MITGILIFAIVIKFILIGSRSRLQALGKSDRHEWLLPTQKTTFRRKMYAIRVESSFLMPLKLLQIRIIFDVSK